MRHRRKGQLIAAATALVATLGSGRVRNRGTISCVDAFVGPNAHVIKFERRLPKRPLRSPLAHRGALYAGQRRRLPPTASSWIDQEVSLEIPSPRQAAYDVYTHLERQPEWSPWLKSVEDDRKSGMSKWVIKQSGITISWKARNVLEVPGSEVAWESTTGLSNRGRVVFEDRGPDRCFMTLTLSYDLPNVIASVLKLSAVERMVKRTLLSDLERFSEVLERDPAVIDARHTAMAGVTVGFETEGTHQAAGSAAEKAAEGASEVAKRDHDACPSMKPVLSAKEAEAEAEVGLATSVAMGTDTGSLVAADGADAVVVGDSAVNRTRRAHNLEHSESGGVEGDETREGRRARWRKRLRNVRRRLRSR